MAAAVSADTRQALLVRHAHADWPGFPGTDFDRPLTPRGEADAAITGYSIRAAGHAPELILVSPARRTMQTAQIIAEHLGLPPTVLCPVDALYNGEAGILGGELRRAATHGLVMLVAHNPGISQLARELSGDTGSRMFAPGEWRLVALR